jgi:hypothetical protein
VERTSVEAVSEDPTALHEVCGVDLQWSVRRWWLTR